VRGEGWTKREAGTGVDHSCFSSVPRTGVRREQRQEKEGGRRENEGEAMAE
jgi:hypothetical protein